MTNSFFLGYPSEFKEVCLIYPPKVKEVACCKNFQLLARVLTLSQEEIEDEYRRANLDINNLPNPFEYLMTNTYNSLQFRKLVEDAFLLFTKEKVIFLFDKKLLAVGDLSDVKSVDDLRMISEEDFFGFQNMIREAIGAKPVEPPNPNEHPRIREMKAKARYRDYIKAKQNKGGLNFQSTLASISCMGMGLNPLNIGELSYAAIPVLIGTYQQKEKYQLDVDSLLAGADSKKVHPVYWIKNLDN